MIFKQIILTFNRKYSLKRTIRQVDSLFFSSPWGHLDRWLKECTDNGGEGRMEKDAADIPYVTDKNNPEK